jgi:putative restriction endonuclease
MKFWVGVTDRSWFDQLSKQRPDEVNFWQPSGKPLAKFLAAGTPFLFKLHSPHNFIVGGGFFVRFSSLPARLAWDAFGDKNGVPNYDTLRRRVERYRGGPVRGDPEIGCNVLNGPFFFGERDWIPAPPSWAPNIVRGRTFKADESEGRSLWREVVARLDAAQGPQVAVSEPPRFGADYLARARLGQGAFRVLVTEAYQRRCAVTGEKTLPVLQAAHIRAYAAQGPHLVANGLLLRSDMHTLFDAGYLTVTPELRVEVSSRLRADFENGREYYRHHGAGLSVVPNSQDERPSREFLAWHNEHRYLG